MAKLPQLTKIKIQDGRRPTIISRRHWTGFQSHWVRWITQNISAKRISTVLYSPILCVHVLIDERNAFLYILTSYICYIPRKIDFPEWLGRPDGRSESADLLDHAILQQSENRAYSA